MGSDAKIRVLIVDDVAETRENVKKLLQFERDFEVVGAARGGREAIQMATQLDPDVVLMDINMPDMDGITATEELRRRLPYVQIVILSVQGDPNYMRRAMLAGARDFLTKPPVVDELITAVRRAGMLAHEERSKQAAAAATVTAGSGPGFPMAAGGPRGKVVTVYSPKGGVGVTTVAVSLAATLQSEDTPTVVVDARLQFGDVALVLNQHGQHSILDLAGRVEDLDDEVVQRVLLTHEATGLQLLAAPTRPENAEQIQAEQVGQVIQRLRYRFEYVVVDTGSDLSEVTLTALDHSDLLLLVVGQDIMSIKDAALMVELLRMMEVPTERLLLVVNMYDKRIPVTPERIADHLKLPLASVIPLDPKGAWTALSKGLPLVRVGSGGVGQGFRNLAKTVRQKVMEMLEASQG